MTKKNNLVEEQDKKMNISAHLTELRYRLFKVIIVVAILAGILFLNIDRILSILIPDSDINLIYTAPADIVKNHITISLSISLLISAPVIIYQSWRFIKPAVSSLYHKKIRNILIIAILLFYIGVMFSYFIILPITLMFLTNYSGLKAVEPMYHVDRYFNFIFSLVVMLGIVFEMPLVITALGYFNLVSYSQLKAVRKYATLIIVILAAVLTPPDIISQMLMAIPMVILFEISLIILNKMEKRREDE